MVNFFKSNFLIFTISMMFMFSTAYTIMFYWNQANNAAQIQNGLDSVDETTNKAPTDESIISAITSGFIDNILGFLAVINPFGILILFLKQIMPADIFQFVDLLLLRPIGWTGTMITSKLVISLIRGVDE